jgi:hypothetical protein
MPNLETSQNTELILVLKCDNKNKAKNKAKLYRHQGFHTKVVESSPGEFSVYRYATRNIKQIIFKS